MPTQLSLCIIVHDLKTNEINVLLPVSLAVKPEVPPLTPQLKTEKTFHPDYADLKVTVLIQFWEHSVFLSSRDLQAIVSTTYQVRLRHFPK